MDAHMVEQIIKYSDGTETSIKYRGVIIDGVLQSEVIEETPAVETVEEVAEIATEEVEETPAESVEESA